MKKSLFIFLLLLIVPSLVWARNDAETYSASYRSQIEYVQAYNSSTAPIYGGYVVGLDTTQGVNPNTSLGQYITASTGSTTDNVFVFGVAGETIPAGTLGRVCIRGPHKVVFKGQGTQGIPAFTVTTGGVISQCANNVAMTGQGVNGGVACPYSTAVGTAGGQLGFVLNNTATTDNDDQGTGSTTGPEYWVWIDPEVNR